MKTKIMRGFRDIPGPKSYPFIGNVLGYSAPGVGRDASQSPRIWEHLNKSFGPLVRLQFPRMAPTVLVFDPSVAEQVYRHEGDAPIRPAFFSLREAKIRNNENKSLQGLLTSNGEEWREFRRKIQKPLLQLKHTNSYSSLALTISEEFVEHIRGIKEKNGSVKNFSDEVYKWALESIAAIALDTRLGCLKEEIDPKALIMIEMVQKILKGNKALDSGLRLWEIFPSKDFDKFFSNYQTFTQTAMKYIKNTEYRPSSSCPKGLISDLALLGCDESTISVMASDLLFGGVDTTSHSTIFALYLLATNQDKQEKLLKEISSSPSSSSDLISNPFLRAVMKESLRIMPAALGNMRQLNTSLVLSPVMSDYQYHIDPGTNYILAHQTMSRSEEWVNKPKIFKPERWIRGHEDQEEINPFVTLPFGFGKRMCVGRRLSEMEMASLIVATLRKFRVGWTGPELLIKSDTLIFPDGDLHFTFTEI